MSYTTKLGYIQLHASEVIERTKAALSRIKAIREKSAEQFITNMMEPKKGWFFGHPARTREQARAAIKADQYMNEEYWYVTKWVSPQMESLETLLRVALEFLNGGNSMMQISIETAALLYPVEEKQG